MTSISKAEKAPTPVEQAAEAIKGAVSGAATAGETIRKPLGTVTSQIGLTKDKLVNDAAKDYLVQRAKVTGDVAVPASRCAAAGSNLDVIKSLEIDGSEATVAGAKAALETIAQEPAKTLAAAKSNNVAAGNIVPNVECAVPAPAPAPAPAPGKGKDKPN